MVNQAEKIIAAFGTPRILAQALGLDTTSVWRWGKRGRIPRWHKSAILDAAERLGKRVTQRMLDHA